MKRFICILIFVTSYHLFSEEMDKPIFSKTQLDSFNQEIQCLKKALKEKYLEISKLSAGTDSEYEICLKQIKSLRDEIFKIRDEWRAVQSNQNDFSEEGYALWDQGEITVAELVMEYGSLDFLYVIPPELFNMKLQVFSGIPIPKESWDEMLEMILASNGIGAKRLNSYVKQLYILKHNPSHVDAVCSKLSDLDVLDKASRVFYVFSPEVDQVRSVQSFFERFSDTKETTIQAIGYKVVVVSSKESVQKLMSLYDAIWEKDSGKVIRVINLQKIQASQAEQLIKALFPDGGSKIRSPLHAQFQDNLAVFTVPQGLVLIGQANAVEKAEKALEDLESQLHDPTEMTVFWYHCKHSNPEDIADVLERVYGSLVKADFSGRDKKSPEIKSVQKKGVAGLSPSPVQQSKTNLDPSLSVQNNQEDANFIVDKKTGSILIVVRMDQLRKIQDLLKKIDVPKKMVQIDVLLVEKKVQDRSQSGINLLKIGSNANRHYAAVGYNAEQKGTNKGILDFIFARKKSQFFPAVDLAFNFLMSQNDIKINANPSVMAINQTPATISIVEEISINNGAVITDNSKGAVSEQSYTRAQYGTILKMTPTIHLAKDSFSDLGFVTLSTDITFDTTETNTNDRPPVTKRSVKNEVTVADGETIILGGLRRKTSESSEEKIPFLGDIPGIGKLFKSTSKINHNSEMFIFITPKIIKSPIDDLRQMRLDELQKRPGDIPEFLALVEEAKKKEKEKLFEKSLELIFER